MKDRFWPAATGLPWLSKPLFTAVSCGEPGAGEPSDWMTWAEGTAAGPGGGSSGPARPQAVNASATKPNEMSAASRICPLVPAQAGTQRWIPAFAGMSGDTARVKALPSTFMPFYHSAAAGRHCVGQSLPGRLLLAEPLEPALGLAAHILRRGAAQHNQAFDRIGDREHSENGFRDPRLDRLHGLERQFFKGDALAGRLGDDSAGDMMRFAE